MLVPLLMDLASAPVVPVNATIQCALPTIYLKPPSPLWVSETPEDTIVVTPNPTPVGSFQ